MTCRHKKDAPYIKWCDRCAEAVAGPKPEPEWHHGDIAESRHYDDFGPYKVLDSEVKVWGQATDRPSWHETLIFRDGQGSADLYKKLSAVSGSLESAALAYGNAVNAGTGKYRELLNALAAAATNYAKDRS